MSFLIFLYEYHLFFSIYKPQPSVAEYNMDKLLTSYNLKRLPHRLSTYIDKQLYKKCWKRLSELYYEYNDDKIICSIYSIYNNKFPEYERGLEILSFSWDETYDINDYFPSLNFYIPMMYFCYGDYWNRKIQYVWWYKKNDKTGFLHHIMKDELISEIIEKDDIYICKFQYDDPRLKKCYLNYKE